MRIRPCHVRKTGTNVIRPAPILDACFTVQSLMPARGVASHEENRHTVCSHDPRSAIDIATGLYYV